VGAGVGIVVTGPPGVVFAPLDKSPEHQYHIWQFIEHIFYFGLRRQVIMDVDFSIPVFIEVFNN